MVIQWHQQFPELLQRFLSKYFANQSAHDPELFASISQLSNTDKRGIFEFVSSQLEFVSPTDVKDYYHNTWIKQFSESPALYRSEIQELVRETVIIRGEEVHEAIQIFVARHPDKKFNLRQLQQVFNIAKYRSKDYSEVRRIRSENSEGFSVSIDQCVLFQAACEMQE
ncbi:Conserved_hypothetical protein [Hexamita inflata]|uniref:Uncharacterized protein n=1 Tax=Hexamita inflata TaxID=28002 RepID=A0AA86N455_9EUKA|nr:Conserved hypothetical protein [Hexamita inflata]CAI9912426.1 Conserved hypothetical protein [Hexamita inflata]